MIIRILWRKQGDWQWRDRVSIYTSVSRFEALKHIIDEVPDDWAEITLYEAGRDTDHFTSHADVRAAMEVELMENYDGPPDGDAWSGGFAANH